MTLPKPIVSGEGPRWFDIVFRSGGRDGKEEEKEEERTGKEDAAASADNDEPDVLLFYETLVKGKPLDSRNFEIKQPDIKRGCLHHRDRDHAYHINDGHTVRKEKRKPVYD